MELRAESERSAGTVTITGSTAHGIRFLLDDDVSVP